MSLSQYPDYKETGIAWLGPVPAHWSVAAVGYRYEVLLGKMLDERRITGEHLAPYLRNVDVQWDRINIENLPEMDFSGNDIVRYALTPGDLLVCEGGEVGRAAIWQGDVDECYYQKALHRLRCWDHAKDVPRFMLYLLRSASSLNVFTASEGKSTIAHLTAETLRRYRFAFPSFLEQKQIVEFLDDETSKIDDLIGEQEKLLELLAEKRRATISHAVTRGLNPDVPMKDSGVEWLGNVPEHWKVVPLKYLVTLKSGGTPSKDNLDYWDGDVPWASAKDLKVERLADTADHITEYAVDTGAAALVPAGAILVVVRGMILARTFPVVETLTAMAINQDLKAIIPCEGLSASFLAWLLRGSEHESLQRLDEAGHGTKALRMDTWTSMQLPIPPVDEQADIAKFLGQETTKLDGLKAEAERAIGLLKERRRALISAAVTGKTDVREHPSTLAVAA